MRAFFDGQYGLPFNGVLISWLVPAAERHSTQPPEPPCPSTSRRR
jgi:hypothetical protein